MNSRASVSSQLRAPSFTPHSGLLQRKCGCSGLTGNCEECDKKKLQKKSVHGEAQTSSAPAIVNSVLNSAGQPLATETRAFMEPRFGHDFSHVRIHVDQKAAESARAVNALAYTVGSDVVFRESQYAPHTSEGRRLLAHELTHVVQQRGQSMRSAHGVTLDDSPELEQEADRVADAALSGQLESAIAARTTRGVQRQPASKPDAPATQPPKAEPSKVESPASACVVPVNGREPESLTRMDTVTVIEICGGSTEPCAAVKTDLGALCAEIDAKPKRVKFRVFHIDSELKENEKLVDRFGKGPQTLVYTERTRSLSLAGKPKNYLDQIRAVYESSLKEGAFKGMEIGAGVGGGIGGIVGSAIGGVMGGFGGAVLGGLLGGAIGAGVGLLVGWAIGAAAAEDIGAKPLSAGRKKEVAEYLEELARKDQKLGGLSSDDLARDAVDQWVANKAKLNLSPRILKLLVLEMLDGTVSRDDQRAILKILENASDVEVLQIFGVQDPPRLLDLEAVFGGTEKEYLLELLEQLRKRFPVLAPEQKTTGLMIENPVVKATLAANFVETHKPEPGAVRRECCGGFIQNLKTGEVHAEPGSPECSVATPTKQPDCATNEKVMKGRLKYDKDHRIAASFHTHPLVTSQVRYAPSAADFQPGWGEPEHYVVDPFNVNLIEYADRKAIGYRILGSTSTLLGVQRIEPPKQMRSTLELG